MSEETKKNEINEKKKLLNLVGADKKRFLYRNLQNAIMRHREPERIIIPIFQKKVWEAGGYNKTEGFGYATCISDYSGKPKTVTWVKRDPYPNGKQALLHVSRNDFIAFGYIKVKKSEGLSISSFIAVYQVETFTDDTATCKKVFCERSFVFNEANLPDHLRNLILITSEKMRTNDCKIPMFVNRWSIYTPHKDEQDSFTYPSIEYKDGLTQTIVHSLEELETELDKVQSKKLRIFDQRIKFINDSMIIKFRKYPLTTKDMETELIEFNEPIDELVLKFDSLDERFNYVNQKFMFNASSPRALRELLEMSGREKISPDEFRLFRIYK